MPCRQSIECNYLHRLLDSANDVIVMEFGDREQGLYT